MGVIVNKEKEQSKLSKRIGADLRNRKMAGVDIEGEIDPDLAEDSEYLKNTKKTGRFGWMWIVLICLAILSVISIVFI